MAKNDHIQLILTEKQIIEEKEKKKIFGEEVKSRIVALNRNTELLFFFYPNFEKHLSVLVKNNVLSVTDNGDFEWLKSTKSLAEYFAYLAYVYPINYEGNHHTDVKWQCIENVFIVRRLKVCDMKNHFQNAKNGRISKDFREIMVIIQKLND